MHVRTDILTLVGLLKITTAIQRRLAVSYSTVGKIIEQFNRLWSVRLLQNITFKVVILKIVSPKWNDHSLFKYNFAPAFQRAFSLVFCTEIQVCVLSFEKIVDRRHCTLFSSGWDNYAVLTRVAGINLGEWYSNCTIRKSHANNEWQNKCVHECVCACDVSDVCVVSMVDWCIA